MTATVTSDDHLTKIATALKAATLESPIIAVVYVSGTNTTIQLLGQMINKIRECVTPKPAEMMTTPCYVGKTWDEIDQNERDSYVVLLGKIMELTAKERVNFCVLNEPYLDARYATADSKYHVRVVMEKILKVIPLPKKVKKNDLTGGILNFGNNLVQNATRAQEPTQTADGYLVKDLYR